MYHHQIMHRVLLLVMCPVVVVTSGLVQCPPCACYSVNTINVTLDELVENSPLYSQVASIASKGANIDSVCLTLDKTCTSGNVLTQQANTLTNGTTSLRASIQTTASTGRFLVTGPTRTYYDSILGSPCPGTYTIYRCPITGTCVTDPANVDVIVASTRQREDESCVEDGIVLAQTAFPGLQFYELPKQTAEPCRCF